MSRSLKKRGKREKKGPENLCSPGLSRRGDPVPGSEGPRGGDGARLTRGWKGVVLVPFHTCVQYGEGMARVEGGRMEGCTVRGGRGVAEIADSRMRVQTERSERRV